MQTGHLKLFELNSDCKILNILKWVIMKYVAI